MSTAQTLLLGAAAGVTIFIGLPIARMRRVSPGVRTLLAATATGILDFLLIEVVEHAVEPVEEYLVEGKDGHFLWLAGLLTAGFGLGLLTLVYYDAWMKLRRRKAFAPGQADDPDHHFHGLSPARWLSLFIAAGIGLHNFSEGLAIGQSAAQDELSLALVLEIGFALHNATEGLGIAAPMSGEAQLPSWGFLGLLGLIGGAPTFVGTAIGQAWTSEPLSVLFLALAGGSLLYVIVQLLNVLHGAGSKITVTWGIMLGLILGFGTDFILVASGA
jgi:ZIP family zinc transporter